MRPQDALAAAANSPIAPESSARRDRALSGSRNLGLGSTAVFAARCGSMALGLVSSVLLARSLGPESFGAVAVALSFAQLGYLLADAQLNALFLREAALAPDAEHSLFRWICGTRLVIGLVVFVPLSLIIRSAVHERDALLGALLILATVPLNAFTVSLAVFQRRLQLLQVGVAYVFQSVLWLIGVVLLHQVWERPSITAVGGMFLATTAIYMASISGMSKGRRAARPVHVGRSEFFRLLRDAAPMGLGVVMVAAYYRLDSYLVFRWTGPTSAAKYAIAYKFLDQAQVIPSILAMTFLPLVATAKARKENLNALFTRYTKVTIWLTGGVVAGTVMLAVPAVNTLYGREYAGTANLVRIVLVAIIPISIAYLVSHLAMVAGRNGLRLVAYSCGLAITVGLDSFLIPLWGAAGAAFTTVVAETVVAVILFRCLRGSLGLRFPVRFAAQVAGALLLGSGLAIASRPPTLFMPVILGGTYFVVSWYWRLLPIAPGSARFPRVRFRCPAPVATGEER